VGPASDRLSDAPDAPAFEIDVPASKRLLPRGGIIPPPPTPRVPDPPEEPAPILDGVPT
jgi:hypothetical protein